MGGIVIKKLYAYITGKSVKQRICICIVLTAVLTLLIFTVKANLFDEPNVPQTPNTSTSESAITELKTERRTTSRQVFTSVLSTAAFCLP